MTKKSEILFLYPQEDGNFIYHLGSNYVIAYLKERGICAKQFVNELPLSLDEITSTILERTSRAVGFTIYDANYFLVKEISRLIKKKAPKITIIAGGPTATFSAKRIMADSPEIDVCVQGEGEVVTYELINSLSAKKGWKSILGITYRRGKKLITTPQRPLLKGTTKESSLDILPSPYLTGALNIKDLIRVNEHRIPFLTSRGCFYRCTYCNFSAMSRHTVRFHSPRRVILEFKILDGLRREGLDFEVAICDDSFTLNRKRVEEICEGIIKENIRLRIVGVEMRADSVDRRLLELLFKAGVQEINFGLESSSPQVLYDVTKARLKSSAPGGLNPEKAFIQKVKEGVEIAKEIGLKTSVSVIFGLPGDTEETALNTLNFVRDLGVSEYAHNILNIHAGTALSRSYKRYGIRKMQKYSYFLSEPILSPLVYPYDVHKIPRLRNEQDVNVQRRYGLSLLTSSISGMYKRQKANLYPEVIFVTNGKFPQELIKNQVALQTRFIYGHGLSLDSSKMTLAVGLDTSCLHPKYSLLTTKELLEAIPDELKFSFNLDGLKNFDNSLKEQHFIFSIRDYDDIYRLKQLSDDNNATYDIGFSARQRQDYLLIDGCRWSSYCTALNLHRLIVDSEGNLKTCFDAEIIGREGDNLHALKEMIDRLYQAKIRERGCNECPIKYTCSKCPFLNPEIERCYCRIRRNNPAISNFINSFQIVRKIDYLCLGDEKEYVLV